MLTHNLSAALILLPLVLSAQFNPTTITVTATQPVMPQFDQVVFSVVVGSGFDKSLNTVTTVSSVGLTSTNLVAVTSIPPRPDVSQPALQWIFQLAVPFTKQKSTNAALTSLQNTIGDNDSGLSLTYTVASAQVSGQQAPSCDFPSLIASARSQAQTLASAGGLSLGSVAGISSLANPGSPICALTVSYTIPNRSVQSAQNTIAITTYQTNTVQPDQVEIAIGVTSGFTSDLSDISSALQAAGINGATFSGISTPYLPLPQIQNVVEWVYTITASFSNLSSTLAQLVNAQQAIQRKNAGMNLAFAVIGASSSQGLQPSSCPATVLLTNAQGQAQQIASAAGLSVGPIVGMSLGSPTGAGSTLAFNPYGYAGFLLGGLIPGGSAVSSSYTTGLRATCSMTVQFQLQ